MIEIIEQSKKLQREVKEKTVGYIMTALGLVAGLAWNDAIKSAILILFPEDKSGVWAQLSYAFLVTILVVIAISVLTRYLSTNNEK